MSEFLLEIYSEEIPARMQHKAISDFKGIFLDFLTKENIEVDEKDIKLLISPRRISLFIQKIAELQTIPATQKIGPKVGSDSKAINGFVKFVGVKNEADLQIIKTDKGDYYAFNSQKSEVFTKDILEKNLQIILQKMSNSWPKNMRWQSDKKQPKWVRPIRSILAIFDGEIINLEFANIKSCNTTFGHHLLSKKVLKIRNFANYKKELENNFVIIDQDERRSHIIKEIKNICRENHLKLVDELDENNSVLNESVGLAEFPQVAIGKIDKNFMSLPKEILILTAKLHQKYFCLEDKKGNLAPYFIFICNVKVNDRIILDNQKVLSARLSDAEFFIAEDLKTPFINRVNDLKNIIFHEKIGTVYDKVKRLEILNKFISFFIPNSNLALVERLADLSKNDLTTKCVAELPELQGIVGGYYAKIQGEEVCVSNAIAEQYLPTGQSSNLPKTPLGSLLALSDKIDTICGLFLVGQKPTSSKDPLALRRVALGIIRIIVHNNVSVPLSIVCEKSINIFPTKILKDNYPEKSIREIKELRKVVLYEVIEFIVDRIKSILKDDFQIKLDVSNVLIANYIQKIKEDKKFDINKLVAKANFINNFVNDKSNANIIALYKRVVNIVNIEEKRDNEKYDSKPHFLLMKDKYEKNLYKKTKIIASKVKKAGRIGDYEEVFRLFGELETPLNDFFNNVKVNVEERNIRENRLLILGKIKTLFNAIFDFSKIET